MEPFAEHPALVSQQTRTGTAASGPPPGAAGSASHRRPRAAPSIDRWLQHPPGAGKRSGEPIRRPGRPLVLSIFGGGCPQRLGKGQQSVASLAAGASCMQGAAKLLGQGTRVPAGASALPEASEVQPLCKREMDSSKE